MSEETTPAAVTPEAGPSFINTDGSFNEGWQNQVIPEDIRGRNQMLWSGMKSVDDLIQHVDNQDKVISRQNKGVYPPGENANPQEILAFHRAIGVPESPDGYTLTIPEGVEKYYQDAELMNEAKGVMHQLGLTPKQFAGIMALDAKRMQQAEQAMTSDPVAFYEEALELAMPVMKQQAEAELREKWGDAYDTRLQFANAAITENTEEGEQRDKLLERIGNDPLVADFIATIHHKHHTESHGVDTSLGEGGKYMSVDQQIQSLMNNPHYMDGKTNPVEHKRIIEEVQRLMLQKSGGKMLE
jgi:hypothetical protein